MAGPGAAQQAQAFTEDGKPIAPEDTAAAVREGRAFYDPGARIYAKNPQGQLVTIAPEDAAAPDYQLLTPAELHQERLRRDAETGVGMAKTAGEGLVRGGTMGFAGLEQFYDAAGRERARARQLANPGIAAGSELAGAVGATIATSALTGGAAAPGAGGSLGARLAAMSARGALTPFRAAAAAGEAAEAGAAALGAGRGILGAGAKLAARGAVEGAAFGVGHEVSEAALENVPLTAERLLAGAWDGAKVGGAFGLGLGVLSAGVGKAGRAIIGHAAETGDDLGKATGTWAERAMFKQQVGNNGKIFDQATNFGKDMSRPARIGRKLLDADMPVESRAALQKADALAAGSVAEMERVAAAADQAGIAANVERLLGTVDDQIAKLREAPFGDFQAVADRVERQIAPFRARFSQPTEMAQASGLADELDALGLENTRYLRNGYRDQSLELSRSAYKGATPEEAKRIALGEMAPKSSPKHLQGKMMEPVRVELWPGEAPALGDGRHRMFAAKEAGADRVLARVVRYDAEGHAVSEVLRPVSIGARTAGAFDEAAGIYGPPQASAAAQPSALKFSELWDLRKKLDETLNWEKAQRGPAQEALKDMRNAFRQELDDTLAGAAETSGAPPELLGAWKKATEDYSDFALIKKSLKELTNRQAKNRAISPSDYATGALMGILTGSAVGGLVTGAVTSGIHKLIRERGLGVMAKIADRAGTVARDVETAGKVAALLETPKRLIAPTTVNTAKLFERYSTAVSQAQADPAKFAEQMGEATADLAIRAPELAQQVQTTMLGDLQYLLKMHPRPVSSKTDTLTPLASTEYYSFDQRKAFVDAAMALDNPVGIFADIARGELPLAGIEALKARRPLLFGEMQQTVVKYTMTRKEPLPFNRRMLLGVAFGFPSDWSMLNVAKIQESLSMSTSGPGEQPPSPNDPRAAPSKVGKDPGADIKPGLF